MTRSPSHLVREFHDAFDVERPDRPTPPTTDLAEIRLRILDEEVRELAEAHQHGLTAIAHELADVVYAAYGMAISYGIDLDAVLQEIHKANMTKLGPDGLPVLRDGKVQKGDHYQPPDVAGVLAQP